MVVLVGAFFLVGSAMSPAALTISGSVDPHHLRYALFLAPAAAAGVLLAHLDVRRTRQAAVGLAVVGAAILPVRQFV